MASAGSRVMSPEQDDDDESSDSGSDSEEEDSEDEADRTGEFTKRPRPLDDTLRIWSFE